MDDFDSFFDWTQYEKIEKKVNFNDHRIIKVYVLKEKDSGLILTVRIYKYAIKDPNYNPNQICDLLTCPDFLQFRGVLPYISFQIMALDDAGPRYLLVWCPFLEFSYLNEVTNIAKIQKQKIIFIIIRSLMMLHDHGIIYQNFNPNKILLDEYCEPLLYDYGLELLVSPDNEDSEMDYYMSPEKHADLTDAKTVSNITSKTDVYSFGIFLYEFISGEKMDESHAIPVDFNDPFYLTVITKCVHPISQQRPRMSEVEQMMLEKLSDEDELHSFLKENGIEKDVHFDIHQRSQIGSIFKMLLLFFVVKRFLPFHLHFFLQFLIFVAIVLYNIDLVWLLLGAFLLQKKLSKKLSLYLIYHAAHNGNGNALLYLANLYEIGHDVDKDYQLAYLLYKLASEHGEKAGLGGVYTLISFGLGALHNTPRSEFTSDRYRYRFINPLEIFSIWIDNVKSRAIFMDD